MQKTINSTLFRKMIIAGAKVLDNNKKFVDSLTTVQKFEFLPYHDMGKYKWENLRRKISVIRY